MSSRSPGESFFTVDTDSLLDALPVVLRPLLECRCHAYLHCGRLWVQSRRIKRRWEDHRHALGRRHQAFVIRSPVMLSPTSEGSAQLKALPCEVECVVELAQRSVSNAFELDAGKQFFGIVAFGHLVDDVLQCHGVCQIKQRSKIGIRHMPMFCPEPKSAEQCRSMVNQVVGRVHNEVMSRVRRRGLKMRPDVLLRLFSEFGEGAHTSGISHQVVR